MGGASSQIGRRSRGNDEDHGLSERGVGDPRPAGNGQAIHSEGIVKRLGEALPGRLCRRVAPSAPRPGKTGIDGNWRRDCHPPWSIEKVKKIFHLFGRSLKGVDFDSIDRKPSQLFFLVMAPENSAVDNLKLLGRIVTLLKEPSFKKRLMEAQSQKELFQIISEEDEKY